LESNNNGFTQANADLKTQYSTSDLEKNRDTAKNKIESIFNDLKTQIIADYDTQIEDIDIQITNL